MEHTQGKGVAHVVGCGGQYKQQGVKLELSSGARSQRTLSTRCRICYGGSSREIVSSNWSGLDGEIAHTFVNNIELYCKQPTFKLINNIKYFIEKSNQGF